MAISLSKRAISVLIAAKSCSPRVAA